MENNKIKKEINDIVNDNLKALEQLFPSAVKDGQLDVKALKEELGDFEEVTTEKYELNWAGKQNAKKIVQQGIGNKTLKFVAKEPKMAAAKMIKMLYRSEEFEFFIDAAQMFCQFVYDKIRLRHQDKEVVLNGGVISVKKDGKNLLSVMPSFKKVSFDDMRNLNDDIDAAVCALGHECEMVYIVCPRNEEFRRHVEVRHCFARGCIKLVPYTIISKIF